MKSESKLKLIITPETKIGELLGAYPTLETTLAQIAPAFKKLSNPVLRRTVARITSLRQAAKVGGVSLVEMINRLRTEVGQPPLDLPDTMMEESSAPRPTWRDTLRVWKTLDARPLIASGQEPLSIVMRDLTDLPEDATYELVAPFLPAPLIDKAVRRGFESFSEKAEDGSTHTYFRRMPGAKND